MEVHPLPAAVLAGEIQRVAGVQSGELQHLDTLLVGQLRMGETQHVGRTGRHFERLPGLADLWEAVVQALLVERESLILRQVRRLALQDLPDRGPCIVLEDLQQLTTGLQEELTELLVLPPMRHDGGAQHAPAHDGGRRVGAEQDSTLPGVGGPRQNAVGGLREDRRQPHQLPVGLRGVAGGEITGGRALGVSAEEVHVVQLLLLGEIGPRRVLHPVLLGRIGG